MEVFKEEEIKQVEMQKPHLVILGAGASYAAFPDGDKNGKKLPLMNNFIETLGIEKLIKSTGLSFKSNNFEDIYSAIYEKEKLIPIREELESIVYNYFSSMELPDEPTIYDHLVLSLRQKDIIATFNWDPFLAQAIERNMDFIRPPQPIFLHGNVKMGSCIENHHMALNGSSCSVCYKEIIPSKLLYPIGEKHYDQDPFIEKQWEAIRHYLKASFMVTVFGYGAPTSDASAIELFKSGWGSIDDRNMEEFEIIDIRNENELQTLWSGFIHSHHYRVESDFYNSWIANHPRRTGEAYINQYLMAKFIENNPLPRSISLSELREWYLNIHQYE
ncbi:hypothetical protein [Colwellia sp. PAMC 21821]|uniref:hypothetical protein n=1 Tax=Colwellia sp. PAMC 21821 TaxID=1816219 RepID=UPI0009BD23EC|nr:hypothetical protein [Colwellia sp. PAMC 21821]ARD46414.1 hypothetical protein A3Q33_20290 [Colwellia sp. PAMC 21821]